MYNNAMDRNPEKNTDFGTENHSNSCAQIRFHPALRDCPSMVSLLYSILSDSHSLQAFIENHRREVFRNANTSTVTLCTLPESLEFDNIPLIDKETALSGIVIKTESVKKPLAILPGTTKALTALKKSLTLSGRDIPHVPPLAGAKIESPSGPLSVLITPAFDNACDLYHYLPKLANLPPADMHAMKAALAQQIGAIFASLHKHRLRHRDAKAQNFLVIPQPEASTVLLLDLDGIRTNPLTRFTHLTNAMAKLAATVMHSPSVTKTDSLRSLRKLCTLLGIPEQYRKPLARQIAQKALAFRLTTMIRSIKPKTITTPELSASTSTKTS